MAVKSVISLVCGEQKKKKVSFFSLLCGGGHLCKHSNFAYTVDFVIEVLKRNYIKQKYEDFGMCGGYGLFFGYVLDVLFLYK
jgi:hypothetical protein